MQVSTGNGQNPIICSMPLKYPKNPGAAITEIRGSFKLSIARRTDQVTSEDLVADRRVEATFEGVKVSVEVGAQEVPGGLTLVVALESNGDVQAVQRLQENFQQLIHLSDAKGSPLRLTGANQSRSDARGSEFQFTYVSSRPDRSGGGPYKLRIDVPSGYRELEVPFVMRDLKMP
jgi:hypothetical protein